MTNHKKNVLLATMIAVSFTAFGQQWNITGNNTGVDLKLGTSDPGQGVTFQTENAPRLSLTSEGKLGLGTQYPNAMLEVNYCLTPSATNGGLLVSKELCPLSTPVLPLTFNPNVVHEVIGAPYSKYRPGEGPTSSQILFPFSYFTGHTTNQGTPLMRDEGPLLWARTSGSNGWMLGQQDHLNTKFIVMPDGSCGINIAQPRAALDIRGSQKYNHPAAIIGSLAQGTYAMGEYNLPQYYTQQVQFVPNLTKNGFNRISQQYDQGMFFSDGKGSEGSNASGAFVLAPWAQEADAATVGGMRMDKFGNTEFHGTVRATKVNVDVKWWSDFVFDDDYQLSTLAEVEAFIAANKHLPNVPSEAEVLENGIDVANMQAIQQQKIEELTLYIIQLKKEMDAMQAQIQLLNK